MKEQAFLEESYNLLVDTVKIGLTQPLSNATVERRANAVKRVKTRLRNCLKNDMLSVCLQVSIYGPDLNLKLLALRQKHLVCIEPHKEMTITLIIFSILLDYTIHQWILIWWT